LKILKVRCSDCNKKYVGSWFKSCGTINYKCPKCGSSSYSVKKKDYEEYVRKRLDE